VGKQQARHLGQCLDSFLRVWTAVQLSRQILASRESGCVHFIAALEMLIAIVFLLPSTRSVGLLLLSGYLGGAISAHLAIHRFNSGGPFLVYMANHPYVGALMPGVPLVLAWMGIWMRHPGMLGSPREISYENELPPQGQRETALASRL
jgi:hypothetical protein